MPYFVGLIGQFDAAVGAAEPLEYHLRYISAGEVLPVLQDLLAEDQTQAGQNQGQGAQQNQQQQNRVNLGGGASSDEFRLQFGERHQPARSEPDRIYFRNRMSNWARRQSLSADLELFRMLKIIRSW